MKISAPPCVCGDGRTLLSNAGAELQRVVLVSKMGVTRAKPPGPFGLGGEGAALQRSEAELRELTAARGVGLSIVRVAARSRAAR